MNWSMYTADRSTHLKIVVVGLVAAILVSVLWTIRTTKEYPPVDDSYKKAHVFTAEEKRSISFWHLALALGAAILAFFFAVRWFTILKF